MPNGVWNWLKSPSVTTAVLVVVAILGCAWWFNREAIADWSTSDATKQSRVAISVGTPTVHTRERLLNDRFEQVAWLDRELRNAHLKPLDAPTAVVTPPASTAPAAAPNDAEGSKVKLVSDMTEQVRYGADDPRKPFEMMNGYRDVLRAERARAMLDDRHDMDDNTLDLFSFDTTVMPRDGMHGSAAIEVLLTRDPTELLPGAAGLVAAKQRITDLKYKDLFDTYVGWLEKVRTVQQSSLDTVTRTLDTVEGWRFNSSDYELLLRRSACSELLRFASAAKAPPATPNDLAEDRQAACRATLIGTTPWDRWERPAPTPRPDALSAMRAIDTTLASVKANVLTQAAAALVKQVRHAQDLARKALEHGTAGANNPALAAYANSPLRTPDEIAAECMAKSPNPPDGAPVVQSWLLDAIKQAFPEQASSLVFGCTIVPKNLPLRTLVALIDKLAAPLPGSGQADPPPRWTVPVIDGLSLSDRDLDRVMTSCVAASLIEENAVRPTAEQPRNHGASLRKFFDIRVDRLVSGCSISIGPRIFSLQLDDAADPSRAALADLKLLERKMLLDRLEFLLEGPGYGDRPAGPDSPQWPATAAYGYSLTPRLRQNVEIRRDSRDSANAELPQASGSFGRNLGLDYRGVEPEVVGFMRSTQAEQPRRGARFGWLLTPRPGKEATFSVPLEQAELSAVVALPSWWRSALLQICTRFVPQANTGDVFTDKFWNHSDQCRVETIRLPGSSLEVSRRLGMDVLTTPYMDAWDTPPVLLAGADAEATQLVITGERLWRNTVVTLGGQKADRIEVLPDMVGIAATFDCIRKPTTPSLPPSPLNAPPPTIDPAANPAPRQAAAAKPPPQGDPAPKAITVAAETGPVEPPPPPRVSNTYRVPVIVWTSEGHTHPQDAFVSADGAKPCPKEPGTDKSVP